MTNDIKLKFVKPHRSIKSLSDTTLPELSAICGPNGSGKTQLLQAIHSGDILITDDNNEKLST